MAMVVITWLLAIPLLGLVTGMRTMTPMAVLCWFAYLGYLPLNDSWASWASKLAAPIIFTVCALGEYVVDKLPQTPNRTSTFPLIARLLFSGLAGAIVAVGLNGSGVEAVIFAVLGTLVGAFGGYLVRREAVSMVGGKDWPVALLEDVSAILLAILAMGVITG